MKVNFKINLTESQKEAYKLLNRKDVRVLVCCWSRQAGKSIFAQIAVIEQLLTPKKVSAYISPSHTLSRKVYKEIVRLLEPTKTILKANATNLTIETIFGSELRFFSAEAANAVRGQTFSGLIVLDEFAFFQDTLPSGEDIYNNIILPTAKARKPKILIISTPRGKRGRFFELFNRALSGEKGYAYIHKTIYDDNLVSEEEIAELKRDMPPLAWRQEFLTEFLDNALTVFQGFEKCFKPLTYKTSKTWIGIDLSADGEDRTVLTKINDDNQVIQYIIEGSLDSKYKKIADIINKTNNLQGVYIESNGIGTVMINEVSKLVRHNQKIRDWTTTNKTKEQIISNLMMEIANGNISFDETNKLLFSELSTFTASYTKNGNMQFKGIGNSHDDTVMSLAIALQAKNDLKTFNDKSIQFFDTGLRNIE